MLGVVWRRRRLKIQRHWDDDDDKSRIIFCSVVNSTFWKLETIILPLFLRLFHLFLVKTCKSHWNPLKECGEDVWVFTECFPQWITQHDMTHGLNHRTSRCFPDSMVIILDIARGYPRTESHIVADNQRAVLINCWALLSMFFGEIFNHCGKNHHACWSKSSCLWQKMLKHSCLINFVCNAEFLLVRSQVVLATSCN